MKGGIRILLALILLWSLYWALAGWGLRRNVEGWFAEQSARGWQVEVADISAEGRLSGYPFAHRTKVSLPTLADPQSGIAWRADWLSLESPAIWPGHQTLRFADGEQRLSWYDRTAVIATRGLAAQLSLAPGLALEVEEMRLSAEDWSLGNGRDLALSGADLALSMVQAAQPQDYRLSAEVHGFRPGAALRRLLRAAPELPQTFETLHLLADVRFDHPWDRAALEERRPQPRRIDLERMEAHWGEMRLLATGELDIDEAGVPSGELALQVEEWQGFLDLAVDTGLLAPGLRDQVGRVVAMLARASGNPEDLDITLRLSGGAVRIGPFPIGAAPRILLR